MAITISTSIPEMETKTSSPTSTISSDGPPTPEIGIERASSHSSKMKMDPSSIFVSGGIRIECPSHTSDLQETETPSPSGSRVARLQVPTNNCTSSLSPTSHELLYTPSVYSPQTPMIGRGEGDGQCSTRLHLGWDDDTEENDISPPAPLAVRKSTEEKQKKNVFDPDSVPKPSFYELEKPYGGTKHFMMAHGLRYYDQDDCDIRREILEQLKELEWRNRVNTAREEFVRTGGKVNGSVSEEGRLPDVAIEYLEEVATVM